jgi:hypothetical protein
VRLDVGPLQDANDHLSGLLLDVGACLGLPGDLFPVVSDATGDSFIG